MTAIKRSAIVLYTAAEMYRLVNNISTYPEFVPWCKRVKILLQTVDEIRATLYLSWGGIDKSFSTCNRLHKDKMVEIRLLDGPFHHLDGYWRFEDLGEQGCKVMLDLEFEFAGKMLDMAFGPVFKQIANSLVECFCKRAIEVYGVRDID